MSFALLLVIPALIMAVIALNKISVLEGRLRKLRESNDRIEAQLKSFVATPAISPESTEVQTTPLIVPVAPSIKTQVEASEPRPATAKSIPPHVPKPLPKPRFAGLEQALAGRWFVVIGGIAVALGGLLFVKYAHDNGLIPPVLRVVVGYVFAALLVAGGEYVRRSRPPMGMVTQDYVPAALSAAGLAIAFAVTYAAYALYDLVSPSVCFPALVAIGLAALWLSRRQGPLIAALGLLGSYAAPALVPSDQPSAWGFFTYLAVIVAASLYELRSRDWWWLGFSAIAGAFVWALLWINGGLFAPDQCVPVAIFAYALAVAASFVPRGHKLLTDDVGTLAEPANATPPLRIAVAGAAAGSVILASMVWSAGYTNLPLVFFAAGMAAIAAFGWLKPHRNIAAGLAAFLTWMVFMAWPEVSNFMPAFDERGFWTLVPQLREPPRFVLWSLAAGAAFTALGFLALLRKPQIGYWAVLLAASAVLFLFGAWARADFVFGDPVWALLASVALAVVIVATYRVKDHHDSSGLPAPSMVLLGASAILALFVVDRLLDDVWYTIAIAALAAAFAYASRYMPNAAPGWIAVAFATLAAVRLFIGREFWSEPAGLPLGLHWPLYGYGIPAALFWWASRQFAGNIHDKAKVSLEGLSLGLLVSLVSLELRVLIGGSITTNDVSLLELGAHISAWLGTAFGLAYRQKVYSSFVAHWGSIALTALSVLGAIAALTLRNPVFTGHLVEGGTFFNSLWLAYLVPAALFAMIINREGWLGKPPQRHVLAALAMLLVMTFATLMVKRWYQGPRMVPEFISDAESYTVSVVWLAMGIAAFVAGLRLDRQNIRLGGMIVLILTVLKVFVLDLSDLTGLWRIASLMGLGLCLIGIGWLYTRFAKAGHENPAITPDSGSKLPDPA